MKLQAIVCGALLLLPLACDSNAEPPQSQPQAQKIEDLRNPKLSQTGLVRILTRDGRSIEVSVEIASNDEDRTRGLMFRRAMPQMAGMIFVFEDEEQRSFWMRNTYLPLDMIFAKADGTILGIVENAEPLTLTSRAVQGASKFVLELNAGFCARQGIGAGDKLELIGMYRLE
ncbi:MAG: DUF192 domain-containing protein [Myxococcales bacterium]|jgi:uncharacterized membrane protein (UPF0127 family)|nr:DUF192 domain-containing protein [Myxococcales bacterium]